jgi:long-subunit fatty acid transport protein
MDMSKQFEDAMGRSVMGFYSQPGTHGTPLDTAFKYIGMNFYNMGIDLTKGVAANYDLEVGLKLPQSIGFGMSYNASPKFRVGMDFEWVNWKNAFDKMTIKLTKGDNSNINLMMGSSDINIDFPLNWKDAVLVKVGGEYDISQPLTLRVGYAYGSNPVPESTIFPIFPAIVENHITFGGSYKFSNHISVNLAVETALNKKLTATDPSSVQSEFSGSTSQLSTVLGHLSLTWNL